MIHIHKNPIIQHAIPQQLSAPKDRTLAVHQAFFDQLNDLNGTSSFRLQGHCVLGGLTDVDEERIGKLIGATPLDAARKECLFAYRQALGKDLVGKACFRGHSLRIQELLKQKLKSQPIGVGDGRHNVDKRPEVIHVSSAVPGKKPVPEEIDVTGKASVRNISMLIFRDGKVLMRKDNEVGEGDKGGSFDLHASKDNLLEDK